MASAAVVGNVATNWRIVGTGDFNGDSMSDILWRDTSGNVAIWVMNGTSSIVRPAGVGNVPTTGPLPLTGDYNGDGKSDLLWRDTSGNTAVWFMNGTTIASTAFLGNVPTNWTVQSVNAD